MRPLAADTLQWGRGQSLVCVSDETYGDVSVPLNGTLEISLHRSGVGDEPDERRC